MTDLSSTQSLAPEPASLLTNPPELQKGGDLPGKDAARPLFGAMEWIGAMLPGVAMAAGVAWIGVAVSRWLNDHLFHLPQSPLSPIMIAVLAGLLVRNTVGVPKVYERGLRLSLRTILQLGIVLLGLSLSLGEVGRISLLGLPVIVCCITAALVIVSQVGKMAGLPPRLTSLIAVGTSICGLSAIAATAPIIEAGDDEVSYAAACITLFGMTALFVYPPLAHWLFGSDGRSAGLFLGVAIHDTSQATGAGLMFKQMYASAAALHTAVVTKLMRNVAMAVVIPVMAVLYHRRAASGQARRGGWRKAIPLFVIGFILAAAIRTLGDATAHHPLGLLTPRIWNTMLAGGAVGVGWCLTMAMAAVGLGTDLTKLKSLGWRPLAVGLSAALLVGGVGVVLIKILTPLMG
jgi:uncharacterized integral membrane protein (TIGR00698 family)